MKSSIRSIAALAAIAGAMSLTSQADDRANDDKKNHKAEQSWLFSTSDMIGSNVVDDQDNAIASIDDLVVLKDGKIFYAILGHGGVLGIGQDHIALPIKRLHVMGHAKDDGTRVVKFHLPDMTSEQLGKAPLLKETGYPELRNKTWVTENSKFFKCEASDVDKAEGTMFANEILATNIYDTAGKNLAAIDDLVFLSGKSKIAYLIVDHEATITDNELVAIPVRAVDWTRNEERELVPRVDTTIESLNAAPRVKVGDFHRFSDKEFQSSLDRVFSKAESRSAN